MLLAIHPENPDERKIKTVVDALKKGAVIIYPTDGVYSIGCDIENHKAITRIARLKGLKPENANFSLVCRDLSELSHYCLPLDNSTFKLMKRALPGPYTFILEANGNVPKLFKSKKKTIGIRVPDHKVPNRIVELLGRPIIATSVLDEDEIIEYTTDPELIHEKWEKKVDIVINSGFGNIHPSTILNCTGAEPVVIREGLGPVEGLF